MFNLEDYETVEDRLSKFWKDYPDGRISTQIIEHTLQRFIIQAAIYRTEVDAQPWATGFAEETVSTRGVNSTSALENCETSAIGRALANAGYASKGKRPSREEMAKVKAAEPKPFAEKLAEKITVEKEDDPWTIKKVEAPKTAAEAVEVVKDIIGGTTEKDVPRCRHGAMNWAHGMTKANKPWGHFKCMAAATGEIDRCPKGEDVIWYEIAPNGSWRPQKARG